MKYKLNVYTIWEYGQRTDADGNPHQEDWTFPQPGRTTGADRLFILCDGMGGHDAGEIASSTVCEAMSRSILAAQPDPEGPFSDEMLQKALSDAFFALDNKDTGAEKKMGTTMAFLKLHPRGGTIAHMGDSRVYHIRPGKTAADTRILFQTKDHSLINDLIAVGELTEEEAKYSNQKNVITRAMQPHAERRPKADIYHTTDIQPGDYFYLCSDGMLENMENPQICYNFSDTAGSDEEKVERLTKATQENRDNHTAIIVHILDVIHPMEEKKSTPAKAVVAPAPLMAEIHDEAGEEVPTQDDRTPLAVSASEDRETDKKADKQEEEKVKAMTLTHPHTPVSAEIKSVKRDKYNRHIGVITLIVVSLIAIALALYFIPFEWKSDKSNPERINPNPQKVENPGKTGHNKPTLGENSLQNLSVAEPQQALSAAVQAMTEMAEGNHSESLPPLSTIIPTLPGTSSPADNTGEVVTSDESRVKEAIYNQQANRPKQ